MTGRIQIVLNPISGMGLGAAMLPRIEAGLRELGYETSVFQTERPGDGCRALEGVAQPPDFVLAIGGDGTVNEVINGLVGRDTPLAIFPTGTSNVFCREIGVRGSVKHLLSLFAGGEVRPVDLGQTGSRVFLSLAGCGPDGYAVHDLAARRKGPILLVHYIGPVTRALFRYAFPPLRVEVDGQLLTEDACAAIISNTAWYGWPFSFTPQAQIDDGVFDIVAFRRRTRWHMIKYLTGGLFRCHTRFRETLYRRGREVRVSSDAGAEVPVQVDGDVAGFLPQTFRVLPGALRVLMPRR